MQIIKESPVLEAASKKGETKYWKKIAFVQDGRVYLQTEYWQSIKGGGESIHQLSAPEIVLGKNIGRSNETTPEDQAIKQLESEVLKQKDKGYVLPGEAASELLLPMLAQEFKKRQKKIKQYPVYVQPKLDGTRALHRADVGFWSRKGKIYLPQVVQHLDLGLGSEVTFDGELILPMGYTFQQTVSAIKKFDPELSPLLEYHIYDILDTTLDFSERYAMLAGMLDRVDNPRVKLVPTHQTLASDIEARHAEFIEQGYEGTMVRTSYGMYLPNHRSDDLLKLKDFVDEEFEIFDVVEGTAKEVGHAIFVARTEQKANFNVRPRGTSEYRQQLWRDRKSLIGKQITVRYQNLTDGGIPRFPVCIAVRDYE